MAVLATGGPQKTGSSAWADRRPHQWAGNGRLSRLPARKIAVL